MTPRALKLLAGLIAAVSLASPAQAALVGNILSGPTTGDGASIYWNPGAMTLRGGTHALAFGAVSAIRLHYQRDLPSAFDGQLYPQADVFVAKPNLVFGLVTDATTRRWRFGLAVSLPILDGATWDESYGGKPASTRHYAMRARLMMLKISPAVAFEINRHISVGAGLDVVGVMLTQDVMTDFGAKINQMACAINPAAQCLLDAPLPREDPTYDARTKIDGTGWDVGAFFGVLVSPTRWLRIGGGFHTGAGEVTLPSDLGVELPEAVTSYLSKNFPSVKLPPVAAKGEIVVTSPMIATVGLSIRPMEKLELAADLHWFNYGATSTIVGVITEPDQFGLVGDQVLIKKRSDGWLTGIRGAYDLLDELVVALRLEYEANTRPDEFIAPVSVDFHKWSIHVGAAWQATRWLRLSLEYGHYFMPDRNVTKSVFAPNANPTTPEEEGFDKPTATGRYFVEADRVGIGIEVGF